MRQSFVLLALLSLASCVVESGEMAEEAVDRGEEAEGIAGPLAEPADAVEPGAIGKLGGPEPTERVAVRTTTWLVPKWYLYELPAPLGKDPPLLAVPMDGYGTELILLGEEYRRYGDDYFRTILHSGYLSVVDLKVIGDELEAGHISKLTLHLAPGEMLTEHFVDPFTRRVDMPVPPRAHDARDARAIGPQKEGEGAGGAGAGGCGVIASCGPDDHSYTGGPTTPRTPHEGPGGGTGGAPPSGGGHGGGSTLSGSWGPRLISQGIERFFTVETVRSFFGDQNNCEKFCMHNMETSGTAAMLCISPAARAVIQTALPCAAVVIVATGFATTEPRCERWCRTMWEGVK